MLSIQRTILRKETSFLKNPSSSSVLCSTSHYIKYFSAEVEVSLQSNYGSSRSSSGQQQQQERGEVNKKDRRNTTKHHHRFVDKVRVNAIGGLGGKGSQSLESIGRKHKRRPDGGHGGNGGSVIIMASSNHQQSSLKWTRPNIIADPGKHGSSQKKHGKNGQNFILEVPCGVQVRRILNANEAWDETTQNVIAHDEEQEQDGDLKEEDGSTDDDDGDDEEWNEYLQNNIKTFGKRKWSTNNPSAILLNADETDDIYKEYLTGTDDVDDDDYDYNTEYNSGFGYSGVPWDEREKVDIADLDRPGSYVVVAKGGRGGIGNSIFSSRHGALPPAEVLAEYARPKEGEKVSLELELKLIAEIGLVGFPNAGKSSLLAAMSRATPQIAPYPFTTMNPIVGYIEYKDGYRVCAADVPGLIEGAADGRGMGHDFLRHLERTKALLYIVDAAGVDGRDPIQDLQILVEELAAYRGGEMLQRHALVVANKMDLLSDSRKHDVMSQLTTFCADADLLLQNDVIGISAGVSGEGLSTLSKAIRTTVSLSEDDNINLVDTDGR